MCFFRYCPGVSPVCFLKIREKFSGPGKHWAKEVCLDYGTVNVKRVDFMQFEPEGVINVSGIEKGI